jgi:IclR family transcriptional regulator, pca regulon regulatory protein
MNTAPALIMRPAAMPKATKSQSKPARAGRHFIGAFVKGLTVIRAFGEGYAALTLSEVAERTGLTRAGARRYLLTLEELGYASHDGRYFRLTPKVLSLGYAYLSSMPLWSFAEPILERLVEDINETCSLSVLDDTEIVYVLRIPVHRILSAGVTVGSRLPAYCNSMGRVLLASLNDAQLATYFSRVDLKPLTTRTVTDKAKLRRIIGADREQGWSWVSGEMQEHIAGLSVPVLDPRGRVVAALNASINRPDVAEKATIAKLLPRLKRAAQQMGASIAITGRPAG